MGLLTGSPLLLPQNALCGGLKDGGEKNEPACVGGLLRDYQKN
jgi:hypothetical protein